MKQLKFSHLADLHVDGEAVKRKKVSDSFHQILKYHADNSINAVIISGDLYDKKQSFCDNSGVPILIDFLKELSCHVDFIFITKGNNSHDEPGSIKLLHQIMPNIYAYEYPVVMGIYVDDQKAYDILREGYFVHSKPDYIVSLVPYPSKSGFITETSIDNNNADFLEKFEQVFELIGDVTQPYTCPKLLSFHGNVVGSRLSTGQTLVSQDIMVAPSTLEKANHDYYALGHIHMRQEIKPIMIYSGSIYNKNWGETEQKSFEAIEFQIPSDPGLVTARYFETINLAVARPMVKIETEFKDGTFETEAGLLFDCLTAGEEYRVRIAVSENDRKLITDFEVDKIEDHFGKDVKIEYNIIPAERESRSEKIMDCNTLVDEVIEYAAVIEQELTTSAKQKVIELQKSEVRL